MKQFELDTSDMKEIAHFISQLECKNPVCSPSQTYKSYIKIYNEIMNKLEEYNKSIKG